MNFSLQLSFRIMLIFWVAALASLWIIDKLSINLEPLSQTNRILISYAWSGATPLQIESSMTSEIEAAISSLKGVKNIKSSSGNGSGFVEVELQRGVDLDFVMLETKSLLRHLNRKWPFGAMPPVIEKRSANIKSNSPLLVYRLNSTNTSAYMKEVAETVFSSILQTPGVDKFIINGAESQVLEITWHQQKLEETGISLKVLEETLKDFALPVNNNLKISKQSRQFLLSRRQKNVELSDWKKISIFNDSGKKYRLDDVAKIRISSKSPNTIFRLDGKTSVTLSVFADKSVNRVNLSSTLKNEFSQLKNKLPKGFELILSNDDARFLRTELNKIYLRSSLSIVILLIFMLLFGRGLYYLIVLLSSIFIVTSLTIFSCWLFSINIHLYTIAGLTISLGLIIDNGIIIADHLFNKSTSSIIPPVIAATLTTIAALSIIWFLPDQEKQNLIEFAVIISISLLWSVISCIYYIPAAFNYFRHKILNHNKKFIPVPVWLLKKILFKNYRFLITQIAKHPRLLIIACVFSFGLPLFMLPNKIEGWNIYNQTLGSDWFLNNIKPWSEKITGGSLRLFVEDVYENYTFRRPSETVLFVQASLPHGSRLKDMDSALKYMEEYLGPINGIKHFTTQVYSPQKGQIKITFEEKHQNGLLPYWLKGRLIARSLERGGADWSVYGVGQGFTNALHDQQPSYRLNFYGYEYNKLSDLIDDFSSELKKNPRIRNIDTDAARFWGSKSVIEPVVEFDKYAMHRKHTTINDIWNFLKKEASTTSPLTYTFIDDRLFPVIFLQNESKNFSLNNMFHTPFKNSSGSYSVIADIAKLEFIKSLPIIDRENRRYIKTLGFDYYGSYKFGKKHLDETLENFLPMLPIGYDLQIQGWNNHRAEEQRKYSLIGVIIFAIFIICAALFESLVQPLWIIICVPLSFIGLFLAFGWFSFSFDQGGYAAFIMLGGLVVNAAIFLLNEYNELSKRTSKSSAMFLAIKNKAIPILLTIVSTCCGLIPFLIGGEAEVFWFSLAVGTIGGLIFSILVIFVVLPSLIIGHSLLKQKNN